MNNPCQFSACRRYRYSLTHEIDTIPIGAVVVLWIGLNPSTADENALDPTLRRVRAFTTRLGGNTFVMANLFAWRDTDPKKMMAVEDPVGPENDEVLKALAAVSSIIVCAWGAHGGHRDRAAVVRTLLAGHSVHCLGTNADGSPRHPLYLSASTPLVPYAP
jgi:hypothetical protein